MGQNPSPETNSPSASKEIEVGYVTVTPKYISFAHFQWEKIIIQFITN
jgi:hypothetical protein